MIIGREEKLRHFEGNLSANDIISRHISSRPLGWVTIHLLFKLGHSHPYSFLYIWDYSWRKKLKTCSCLRTRFFAAGKKIVPWTNIALLDILFTMNLQKSVRWLLDIIVFGIHLHSSGHFFPTKAEFKKIIPKCLRPSSDAELFMCRT